MYPDIRYTKINGESAEKLISDREWYENYFIPTVAKRGAAIIDARGLSSAASAANAAIDHIRIGIMVPQNHGQLWGFPQMGNTTFLKI